MASRKKRKFNWDELSSEEDEVQIKVSKKNEEKIENRENKSCQIATNNKPKEDNINLTLSDEEVITETVLIRSNKRKFDEIDVKSNAVTIEKLPKKDNLSIKEENLIDATQKITIKQEDLSEKDAKYSSIKLSPNVDSIKLRENRPIIKKERCLDIDEMGVLNVLPSKNVISENQNYDYKCDFDLPTINIKSIKLNMYKKQNSSKKFNKKHFNLNMSPMKTKFSEIKIELNNEQKDWLNKQIQKYDGDYDREFDVNSDLYLQPVNIRKRKY